MSFKISSRLPGDIPEPVADSIRAAVESISDNIRAEVEHIRMWNSDPKSYSARIRALPTVVEKQAASDCMTKTLDAIASRAAEVLGRGIAIGTRPLSESEVRIDLYEGKLYAHVDRVNDTYEVEPTYARAVASACGWSKNRCWRKENGKFVESEFTVW